MAVTMMIPFIDVVIDKIDANIGSSLSGRAG